MGVWVIGFCIWVGWIKYGNGGFVVCCFYMGKVSINVNYKCIVGN